MGPETLRTRIVFAFSFAAVLFVCFLKYVQPTGYSASTERLGWAGFLLALSLVCVTDIFSSFRKLRQVQQARQLSRKNS